MSAPINSEEVVRQGAEWMQRPGDDTILELIREHGHLTPAGIEYYAGDSPRANHASRRASTLADAGMLEEVVEGLYRITDDGEQWLEGDLDASTLDPTDD
jgi:hypothetical protein